MRGIYRTMTLRRTLFLLAIALAAAAPVRAALIINGDFSADGWPAGTITPGSTATPNKLTSITGWSLLPDNNIVAIGPGVASIPTYALELTGWGDNIINSGLSQTLGTTAGSNYTISFMVYDIGASISKINFSLNGNLLGSNLNAQGGSIVGGTTKGQQYSYNFTAAGSDVISFLWPGPANSTQVSILADVQVTSAAAVPEPGSWAAAALLVGGAALARWRKRRAKVVRELLK